VSNESPPWGVAPNNPFLGVSVGAAKTAAGYGAPAKVVTLFAGSEKVNRESATDSRLSGARLSLGDVTPNVVLRGAAAPSTSTEKEVSLPLSLAPGQTHHADRRHEPRQAVRPRLTVRERAYHVGVVRLELRCSPGSVDSYS
jgi:hypothetical protein